MFLDFLEWLALIKKKSEFVRRERLKSKQIAKPMGHIFTQIPADFILC
jgi:hypothetical protein